MKFYSNNHSFSAYQLRFCEQRRIRVVARFKEAYAPDVNTILFVLQFVEARCLTFRGCTYGILDVRSSPNDSTLSRRYVIGTPRIVVVSSSTEEACTKKSFFRTVRMSFARDHHKMRTLYQPEINYNPTERSSVLHVSSLKGNFRFAVLRLITHLLFNLNAVSTLNNTRLQSKVTNVTNVTVVQVSTVYFITRIDTDIIKYQGYR